MGIVLRVETDMFVFADVVGYMVNPVNLVKVAGAGLALEFKKRAPEFMERYKEACDSKELRMGTVVPVETNQNWDMILLPTKSHFYDTSDSLDITRGLEALRELLKQDRYKYASVGLPMLGCGLGKQDYDTVFPLMKEHLSDLDATVIISMAPDKTELRPRYLLIAGPPGYGETPEQQKEIDEKIDAAMDAWGMSLSDYTGILSGGLDGVDTYIGGRDFNKNYEDTFVYKRTGGVPLVIKPDKAKDGIGSNLIQNQLLCELAHDIILLKPEGYNNNRMSLMQLWITGDRIKRHEDGHEQRRVAVSGEREVNVTGEKLEFIS